MVVLSMIFVVDDGSFKIFGWVNFSFSDWNSG